ncbi:MAG TPA: 3-hydroxybutyryl-CoA dehydrogenase [Candidatus Polarisedimenticolaceae bacterium]|nr:3-hydroxybutyryl-CoA dehydrogenase [Candidatus Polarisedimenticolaceae bacterium]
MKIERLGVIGAGQMGNGIAHVAAAAGIAVTMRDIEERFVQKGLETIAKNLQRGVDKGKMTGAEKDATLEKISGTTRLEDLADCDFVVEAAVEKLDVKLELFGALDKIVKPKAILATNTSSLPITRIAAATKRPEKVIGMHFMNPVPVMKLVEVIRGLQTTDETAATTKVLAETMGKTPVFCRDFPGFVSNRVLMPLINEAIFCLHEGVADAASIDTIMKLGMNHPMGPLTLADFIGLDTCLYILEVLHEGLGEAKYRPCPLLRKYVEAGWLGKKSGRGFYDYTTAGAGASA